MARESTYVLTHRGFETYEGLKDRYGTRYNNIKYSKTFDLYGNAMQLLSYLYHEHGNPPTVTEDFDFPPGVYEGTALEIMDQAYFIPPTDPKTMKLSAPIGKAGIRALVDRGLIEEIPGRPTHPSEGTVY